MYSKRKLLKIPMAVLFCALVSSGMQARAANVDAALIEAQKFEACGSYVLAGSAYLAIVEGFDFVPDTEHSASISTLTKDEKIRLGKHAIECFEKGIKQSLADGESLRACQEFELLRAATMTMSE
jgi:hypothetical protein